MAPHADFAGHLVLSSSGSRAPQQAGADSCMPRKHAAGFSTSHLSCSLLPGCLTKNTAVVSLTTLPYKPCNGYKCVTDTQTSDNGLSRANNILVQLPDIGGQHLLPRDGCKQGCLCLTADAPQHLPGGLKTMSHNEGLCRKVRELHPLPDKKSHSVADAVPKWTDHVAGCCRRAEQGQFKHYRKQNNKPTRRS